MGRNHKYPVPESFAQATAFRVAGKAPPRPRNEFERLARAVATGRHASGRPVAPTSKTQLALQHAAYLVGAQGMSHRAAARISASAFGLSSSDNLRALLRKALVGPQTTISHRKGVRGPWAGLLGPKNVPLLVGVVDVVSKKVTPNTDDPDGLEQLQAISCDPALKIFSQIRPTP